MYAVSVTAYAPFPITFNYSEQASNFHTAIARAIRKYRAEGRIKGKHIDNLNVKAGCKAL